MAEKYGMRLSDLFVLLAKSRMTISQRTQKHARIYHSYFLVFKKTNQREDDENPLFRQMIEIMRTPPKWCADLPLDGEGGTAAEYSK